MINRLSRDRLIALSRLSGWTVILLWWWSSHETSTRFHLNDSPLWFYLALPLLGPYAQWLWTRLTASLYPDQALTAQMFGSDTRVQLYQRPRASHPNMHARGTIWHPVVLIDGTLDHFTEAERHALFWHEWAHLKYWDLSCNILIFLCTAGLTHHMLLSVLALRAYSRFTEFRADRESLAHTESDVLIRTLQRLDSTRHGDWLEYLPIVNLIATHPSTESRIRAIQQQHPLMLTHNP